MTLLSTRIEPSLETMAVKVRPYWSPRKIGHIIFLLVHAIVFGLPNTAAVRETTNNIYSEIDKLEKDHPNTTLFVLGDFNSIELKLPRFKQCKDQLSALGSRCWPQQPNFPRYEFRWTWVRFVLLQVAHVRYTNSKTRYLHCGWASRYIDVTVLISIPFIHYNNKSSAWQEVGKLWTNAMCQSIQAHTNAQGYHVWELLTMTQYIWYHSTHQ